MSSVFFSLLMNNHEHCVAPFSSRMLAGVQTAFNKSSWITYRNELVNTDSVGVLDAGDECVTRDVWLMVQKGSYSLFSFLFSA